MVTGVVDNTDLRNMIKEKS